MASKKKRASWENKRKKIGFRFVLPFVIGSVFFIVIPVLKSLLYSFCSLDVTSDGFALTFEGVANYEWLLLTDPNYRTLLLSSLTDMLVNVPVAIIFSFFIASLLNQKFHGRGLARGILFLPVILSSGIYIQLSEVDSISNMVSEGGKDAAASGTEITGAFVNFLTELNMDNGIIQFLVASVERISIIVAMSAIPIIIFLAGFQSISPSIFEAAYMEGATKWETFWKISFPMVSSLILVSVVYTMVDSFTSTSNDMINLIHNTIFTEFNFGVGNAMAWIYLVVIFAILGIVYSIINKHIFYYD